MDRQYLYFAKVFILFCLVVLFKQNSFAQILGQDLLNDKKSVEIPFDYISGFIVLDVKYNNILPLKFIFDTGAANTILFNKEYSTVFNNQYSDTIKIIGADVSNELEGYVVRNGKFELNQKNVNATRDYIVLSEDYMKMEKRMGIPINGILGADFFKRLAIGIDYRKQIFKIRNPDKLNMSSKWTKIPIEVINGKPYINTTVNLDNKPINLRLLIDTGASISLLIHPEKSDIKLPSNSIPGYLGTGLSGNLIGHIGLINKLDLGPYEFQDLITNFQNIESDSILKVSMIRDGIIGNVLLSKFDITIDYVKEILYLKPNKNYKKEIKIDKSGLIIHAFGEELNQFIVHYVYPNSPADISGIVIGDIIEKIGRCKRSKLTLDKINRKLTMKKGTKVSLKIYRNQQILDFDIILDNLIKKANH